MTRLLAAALWLLLLISTACQTVDTANEWDIHLSQSMFDTSVNRLFFRRGIGWDSIPTDLSVMHFPEAGLMEVQILGADVAFKRGDSLRIAIIRPIRKLFSDSSQQHYPDLLLLTSPGQDSLPLSFKEEGLGAIRRQTYFSVGKQYYHLSSVDSSRQKIVVQALPPGKSRPKLTAAINLRFKPIAAKTLEQQNTTIHRPSDKALLIYFWSLGPQRGKDLLHLDSLYQSLPNNFPLAIVAINRNDNPQVIQQFQQQSHIKLPLFLSTSASCEGLNCQAILPHAILVNRQGRFVRNDLDEHSLFHRWPFWVQSIQAAAKN